MIQFPSFPDLDKDTALIQKRTQLKRQLRSVLAKSNGNTKHVDVMNVIDELSQINPASNDNDIDCPITEANLFEGEYRTLSAPNFPGRLKTTATDDHQNPQYTLGRLAFKIFKPYDLVCSIVSLGNSVHRMKGDDSRFTYTFVVDILIHTSNGEDLPAMLVNDAYCYQNETNNNKNNRVSVAFTGGTLIPKDEVLNDKYKSQLWSETFGEQKTIDTSSYLSRLMKYVIFLLLGVTQEHSLHFEMKRCPVGFFDVLYLDNEIRITRGNQGSVVVVERERSTATTATRGAMQVVG